MHNHNCYRSVSLCNPVTKKGYSGGIYEGFAQHKVSVGHVSDSLQQNLSRHRHLEVGWVELVSVNKQGIPSSNCTNVAQVTL